MANKKRLIDANLLIEMFSGGEAMKSMAESIHDERFVEALRNAPAVDAVEVAHGRREEPYRLYVVCSKCGTGYVKYEFIEKANYCPNCGAKMDGDGND